MLLERQDSSRPLKTGTLFGESIHLLGIKNWFFPYFSENNGFVRYALSGNLLYVSFLLGDLGSNIMADAAITFDLITKEMTIIVNRSYAKLQIHSYILKDGAKKYLLYSSGGYEIAVVEVVDGGWIPYHMPPEEITEMYVDIETNNFERCFPDEHHSLENFSGKTKFILSLWYEEEVQ